MLRIAKPFLIIAAVVVFVLILAIFGLNLYLQSAAVQQRIRDAATQAVGRPVQIQTTYYFPWSGVRVSGIRVPSLDGDKQPALLEMKSVGIRFAFLPFLQGKLEVKDLVFEKPTLILMSKPRSAPVPPATIHETIAPLPTPLEAPTPGSLEITIPKPAPDRSVAKQGISVESLRVREGQAMLYNTRGLPIAVLNNVTMTGIVMSDGAAYGDFMVEEATILSYLHPRGLSGKFSYKEGRLVVWNVFAHWAEGSITADFQSDANGFFAVNVAAKDVSLQALTQEAGLDGNGKKGVLFGSSNLVGAAGRTESLEGQAEIRLEGARVEPVGFLKQLGELLAIEELKMLDLRKAEAFFTIANASVRTDRILLESDNLQMDATGNVSFDGKLDLAARLHLNEKLRRQLGGMGSSKFKPSEREGYQFVPFKITGTTSRPQTDLDKKLLGVRIGGDLTGLLRGLLRPPDRKKAAPQSP